MIASLAAGDPRSQILVARERSAGLAAGWALLEEAGSAIADLAQVERGPDPLSPRDFAMRAAAGGPMRVLHAEQMIDDAAATLHVGLTALARAIGEGHDIAAASMMLWREYERARQALVGLAAAET